MYVCCGECVAGKHCTNTSGWVWESSSSRLQAEVTSPWREEESEFMRQYTCLDIHCDYYMKSLLVHYNAVVSGFHDHLEIIPMGAKR